MRTPKPSIDDTQDAKDPAYFWSDGYVQTKRTELGHERCLQLAIYSLPSDFLLSVIVPVYNEFDTITRVIDKLRRTGLPMQLIVVDDGSTDGTGNVLDAYRSDTDVIVIQHSKNRGKGAAIRRGIPHASGSVIVIQDADDEYDPADFRVLLQPLLLGDADVAYGTRFGHRDRQTSPWWHRAVNHLITSFADIVIGVRLTDIETCYKMALRQHFEAILGDLRESRFGIEIELTARWARLGLRFTERPIGYNQRCYGAGKKIGWRDGFSALRCIVQYGLLRR